MGGKTELAQFH